jgi:hypothetical protein
MLKFVLIEKENNVAELRFANVELHSDMVLKGEKCLGGGFFKIKEDTKQLIMWDKSHDFGYPKFEGKKIVTEEFGFEDYTFYYVPDLFMPLDADSKVDVKIL